MHHVSEEFSSGVADFEVEAICAFDVDAKDALVALEERQRAVRLQIEVKGADDQLFQPNQLLTGDLLAQQGGQALDHHVEAGVHVLVHFCGEKNTDRRQLNEIGCLLSLGRKYRQVAVCNAHCKVEGVLSVALDPMELLDEGDHRLTILRADPQRVPGQLKVVSDGTFAFEHREVCVLGILRCCLPASRVTAHQTGKLLVLEVKLRQFVLEYAHPAIDHDLTNIQGVAPWSLLGGPPDCPLAAREQSLLAEG